MTIHCFGFAKGAIRQVLALGRRFDLARFLVTGDDRLVKVLLPDLVANYEAWEKDHRDANGLFWQSDDRDGMEESIGGSGYRVTINSYMYGDAVAIAKMAGHEGRDELAKRFRGKAAEIKQLVQERLWDAQCSFSKCCPVAMGNAWSTCASCMVSPPGISSSLIRKNQSPGGKRWIPRASSLPLD